MGFWGVFWERWVEVSLGVLGRECCGFWEFNE